jgi:uncharacterized membrane protein
MEFLSLTAGGTIFVAAFVEGRKAGAFETCVGLVFGLAIGFGVFWGTRVTLKWAVRRLNLHELNHPPMRLALSWLICLVALVGMVGSGIIVTWLTRQVVHLMQ